MADAVEKPQPQPSIDIIIRWIPQTGQIQIAWPAVDDTIKFGVLEMAKSSLIEARIKAASQGRILPVTGMAPGWKG